MARFLVLGLIGVGCTATPDPAPIPPGPPGPPEELLPTAKCGERDMADGPTANCAAADGLCFGSWGSSASLSVVRGDTDCVATPVPGTVTMTAGGAPFASDAAAALVYGTTLEVSARDGDVVVAFALPSTPGSYDCASEDFLLALGYFQRGGGPLDFRSWIQGQARSCTIVLQHVGDVGDVIAGRFSATLYDWSSLTTGATLELVNGTFSVQRTAY